MEVICTDPERYANRKNAGRNVKLTVRRCDRLVAHRLAISQSDPQTENLIKLVPARDFLFRGSICRSDSLIASLVAQSFVPTILEPRI